MSDLQARSAEFEITDSVGDRHVISGKAPVATLHGYARDLISYTRGEGTLSCVFDGYEPCGEKRQEEAVKAASYSAVADVEHSPDSIFCSHGAGFLVHWQDADGYMHIKF
jgi:predicted membrane GTPase involved in stress response